MNFAGGNNNGGGWQNEQQGQGDIQRAVENWYRSIPPVTKYYMVACVVTTFAVQLEVLSIMQLYLNYYAVWYNHEVWRLLTNFLFFDYFGINFIFHMYFVIRHSRMLEETSFHGKMAEYLWMWLFSGSLLLGIAFLCTYYRLTSNIMFLAPSLAFVMVYVWSKRNRHMHMSFLYLFTFSAPYLPWVILGFGWVIGQNPVHDLLGIGVGHIYYFLEDVLPAKYGVRPLRTPGILKAIFNDPEEVVVVEQPPAVDPNMQQQQEQQEAN